jgi:hypothetical protein
MSHVRQQIRDAVIVELKKIAAFGNRVYGYRGMVQRTAPYVVARTPSEGIDLERSTLGSGGHPTLMRELRLEVEVYAKAAADIEDTMDGYAVSIEEKLAGTALNALAVSILPTDMALETAEDDEAIEQDAARMTLGFGVKYRTVEGSPETVVL